MSGDEKKLVARNFLEIIIQIRHQDGDCSCKYQDGNGYYAHRVIVLLACLHLEIVNI